MSQCMAGSTDSNPLAYTRHESNFGSEKASNQLTVHAVVLPHDKTPHEPLFMTLYLTKLKRI